MRKLLQNKRLYFLKTTTTKTKNGLVYGTCVLGVHVFTKQLQHCVSRLTETADSAVVT